VVLCEFGWMEADVRVWRPQCGLPPSVLVGDCTSAQSPNPRRVAALPSRNSTSNTVLGMMDSTSFLTLRAVQDGQAGRPKGDDVGVVERGTRCLSPSQFTQPSGAQPNSLSASVCTRVLLWKAGTALRSTELDKFQDKPLLLLVYREAIPPPGIGYKSGNNPITMATSTSVAI
jgi:hypothetical protein